MNQQNMVKTSNIIMSLCPIQLLFNAPCHSKHENH